MTDVVNFCLQSTPADEHSFKKLVKKTDQSYSQSFFSFFFLFNQEKNMALEIKLVCPSKESQ